MVATLPPPPGMIRTADGLLVPAGSLEATLNKENRDFLKVKDTLHLESLTGAVTEKYLASVKVIRDGVAYYDPKGKETHQALSELVMDELDYHLHQRVYKDISPELYERMKAIKDPTSGESYTTTITKVKYEADTQGIKQFFDKNGATQATVSGLVLNLGEKWFERELTGAIHKKYGDDLDKYKAGIENFRTTNLGIGGEFNPERLAPLGVKELLGVYVGLVGQALDKTKGR